MLLGCDLEIDIFEMHSATTLLPSSAHLSGRINRIVGIKSKEV